MAPVKKSLTQRQVAEKYGFRSGLEEKVAADLRSRGVEFSFEAEKVHYRIPESNHVYTPDFIIRTRTGKKIVLETKGRFMLEDRQKHLFIKEQYPELDLRFLFQSPNAKICKGSRTTYKEWAEKHGFKWASNRVPEEWLNE